MTKKEREELQTITTEISNEIAALTKRLGTVSRKLTRYINSQKKK